jgi:hypothetical protein
LLAKKRGKFSNKRGFCETFETQTTPTSLPPFPSPTLNNPTDKIKKRERRDISIPPSFHIHLIHTDEEKWKRRSGRIEKKGE